ncbi:hypothetical protein FH972_023436 [Carpinus fangiana]|uniref:Uncharacterized protein n=1 Tax=Carpinus fangiana TaxID=176857 RepID=A0A5N6KVP4_9ROSI|nr:hypothetical protein FH972_023436 [Carpinus fangiana]
MVATELNEAVANALDVSVVKLPGVLIRAPEEVVEPNAADDVIEIEGVVVLGVIPKEAVKVVVGETFGTDDVNVSTVDAEGAGVEGVVEIVELEFVDVENVDVETVYVTNVELEVVYVQSVDKDDTAVEAVVGAVDVEIMGKKTVLVEMVDAESIGMEVADVEIVEVKRVDVEIVDAGSVAVENVAVVIIDVGVVGVESEDVEAVDVELMSLEIVDVKVVDVEDDDPVGTTLDAVDTSGDVVAIVDTTDDEDEANGIVEEMDCDDSKEETRVAFIDDVETDIVELLVGRGEEVAVDHNLDKELEGLIDDVDDDPNDVPDDSFELDWGVSIVEDVPTGIEERIDEDREPVGLDADGIVDDEVEITLELEVRLNAEVDASVTLDDEAILDVETPDLIDDEPVLAVGLLVEDPDTVIVVAVVVRLVKEDVADWLAVVESLAVLDAVIELALIFEAEIVEVALVEL